MNYRKYLLATTVICGAAVGFAAPAFAQVERSQSNAVTAVSADDVKDDEAIVITGSLFARTNSETPSPVTTLSEESLALRGITNVADAIRTVSADNSGSIPSSFSNGFGSGAAGVSLRGLTVNATITLVDGLRTAYYPLTDDGQRSFVDLNTLPKVAIDRIEVLKDGASSTYGADAIGGVVNVLMKKNFQGVEALAEWGTSEHGGGDELRASVIAGFGDYDANNVNFYVGAEYEKNDAIFNRDRGFPYNTFDLTSLPGGLNLNFNTLLNGSTTTVTVVRPATQSSLTNLLSGAGTKLVSAGGTGTFTVIGAAADCTSYGSGVIITGVDGTGCSQNPLEAWGRIQPETERWGVVARAAVRVNDNMEAYVMGSFYRSNMFTGGAPLSTRVTNPLRTTGLVLPVRLTDGSLNPNNPYALGLSTDTAALLYHRFTEVENSVHRQSDVVRIAAGLNGSFGEGWTYSVDMAAASSRLHSTFNAIHLQSLLDAINNNTYNFRNRADPKNAAALALIVRELNPVDTSSLYMAQGYVAKELTQLAGGPLQLALGAQVRLEEVNKANANASQDYLGINQYSTIGDHTVWAGFFELSAPVLEQLELQASGRYDHYSEGFSRFSPKVGFKFTPIKEIALRGTYSRGFRAPGFGETGPDSGVIGFVNTSIPCSAKIQHGATGTSASCSGGNAYVTNQGLGFNSTGNPNLKPEKSESYTLGLIVQPTPWFSFTVDYYNIRMKDLISQGPLAGAARDAYYAGLPLPAGYTVTLNPVDPDYPTGIRTIFTVNSPYANAALQKTDGLDVSATVRAKLSEDVKFTSTVEVTDIFHFDYKPDAATPAYHYVGTQGPNILSSGAGTPKWRGNWSNTLQYGGASLTATVSYVSGTHTWAEDVKPGQRNCAVGAEELYNAAFCFTDSFVNVDLVGSYDINEHFNIYFNVLNLFDAKAPINPANYAGNLSGANYNPTWHQAGAVGRFFRVGAKAKF